jgi:FkbM family methyltransferase
MRLWPEHTRCLLQIFLGEYSIGLKRRPKVILDLGANLGYASIYFALRYPSATVYALEPDPQTYRKLVRNTKWLKRIVPVQVAVTNQNGTTTFYHSESSISSSLVKRKNSVEVNVPCTTLESFMRDHGIAYADLIKFDVEGAEYDVFEHFDLSKAGAVIGVFHQHLVKEPLADFLKLFPAMEARPGAPHRYLCTATL